MTLTTEELGDVPDVNAAALDELLAPDAFGKFAILSASDAEFIQAGNDWAPGAACAAFMKTHDSDPWVLEYREDGRHFRAEGQVTLEQVRQARTCADGLPGTSSTVCPSWTSRCARCLPIPLQPSIAHSRWVYRRPAASMST